MLFRGPARCCSHSQQQTHPRSQKVRISGNLLAQLASLSIALFSMRLVCWLSLFVTAIKIKFGSKTQFINQI